MIADLVLHGGRVVNVYTREILPQDVAIVGDRIAYVGADAQVFRGASTTVLDVTGQVVLPGFVDGHAHADFFLTVSSLVQAVLRTGTTTIFTEADAVTSALGGDGVRGFLEAAVGQPVKIFVMAPTISYLTTDDGAGRPVISMAEMLALRGHPGVAALGEVYWPQLLSNERDVQALVAAYREAGKPVEGHSAGARGPKLAAFAAAGVTSCHEATTAAEAAALLRLGLFAFLREGSVREDLAETLELRRSGLALDRVGLASDGLWPDALTEGGYMDRIVQRAIDLGLEPLTAIQMATINPVRYFGYEGRLGAVAPHREADLVVVPSEREVRPRTVVSRGRLVLRDGDVVATARAHAHSPDMYRRLRWPEPVEPARFRYAASGVRQRVRVVRFVGDIRTRIETLEVPVRDGELVLPDGICRCAVFHRARTERYGLGLISGLGLGSGAVASTMSFDSSDVVVLGREAAAMAAAARRVEQLGGGIAVCAGERVLAEVALPFGGIASDEPAPRVGEALKAVTAALRDLGMRGSRPLLSVQAVTFTAIPDGRITFRGLLDVKARAMVSLFA